MDADELDRATGALVGLALGDALGMPTQLLTVAEVAARYGLVDRFHEGPADHPIAAGHPAGRVTDDTDQAVIIGRLLVAGRGHVDPYDLARELTAWQARMVAAGSQDLLGPSTTRAIDAIAAGEEPLTAGRSGATNGAAMRIAPVGIVHRPEPLGALVAAVAEVCQPTHGTGVAIAGAAAVAAAVSMGVERGTVREAIELAVRAADEGAAAGGPGPGGDIALLISAARAAVAGVSGTEVLGVIDARVGTSLATTEAVPAAFAIVSRFADDPWAGICHAASLGGDSDTIAAMAGAVLGACHGRAALPTTRVAELERANPELDLTLLAGRLLRLRDVAR